MERIKKICKNCDDFCSKTQTCTIRFVINKTDRKPMPRKPEQKGCEGFMYKVT